MYDTKKKLQVIFQELLTEDIQGKLLLDAGSGTGWFSREAVNRGAKVASLDVGEKILSQVAKKCDSNRVVGSILDIPFDDNHFYVVISTEVIEHTPTPRKALFELSRILKKNGILVLTVPNKAWHFAIAFANKLKLRPYEGYENWVGWSELKAWLDQAGFTVVTMKGLYLFPFVFPFTYKILTFADKFGDKVGPMMLNICVKAIKK